MKKFLALLTIFVCCCAMSQFVHAQETGRVIDLTGQGVADVSISFTQTCNPPGFPSRVVFSSSAVSKADGSFSINTNYPPPGQGCGGIGTELSANKLGYAFSDAMGPVPPYSIIFKAISPVLTNVSAASFKTVGIGANGLAGAGVATESMIAGFGTGLAATTVVATETPYPIGLGDGYNVLIQDANGIEHFARLIFISPTQVNYVLPAGVAFGKALITFRRNAQTLAGQYIYIIPSNPGIFCANNNGRGVPAAYVTRVKPGNIQSIEPIARYDATARTYVPLALDLGAADESLYLSLFGTGWRWNVNNLHPQFFAKVSGTEIPCQITYVGAQPTIQGLDQINVLLPRALLNKGEITAYFKSDQGNSNEVVLNFK